MSENIAVNTTTNQLQSDERNPQSIRRFAFSAISAVGGACAGAFLFGQAGSLTHNSFAGIIAGTGIGAIIGWGLVKAVVRPYVAWMILFAVGAAFCAAGCDADPLASAIWGASFGALFQWRGAFIVVGAAVGACALSAAVGFWIGGLVGWIVSDSVANSLRNLVVKLKTTTAGGQIDARADHRPR